MRVRAREWVDGSIELWGLEWKEGQTKKWKPFTFDHLFYIIYLFNPQVQLDKNK